MRFIKTHPIPPNASLSHFATKNSGYRRYITHRLLLDLNSKDRDMLEGNNNIIYHSNLKFKKYMCSRNVWSNATSQGNPLTRHIIKSNDSIALVWEVAFELHLLSPSDFNSTIVVKMPSHWSMTEESTRHASCWDQWVLENFCRHFLLRCLH